MNRLGKTSEGRLHALGQRRGQGAHLGEKRKEELGGGVIGAGEWHGGLRIGKKKDADKAQRAWASAPPGTRKRVTKGLAPPWAKSDLDK